MRYAAMAARFGLFHVLSVLLTAVLTVFGFRASAYGGGPLAQLEPSLRGGIELTAEFGPLLLIPSAIGWGICWLLLRRARISTAGRVAWQGVAAGLGAAIYLAILTDRLVPPTLIGLPIGALVGWLVYCRIWPPRPAAQPAA